MLVAVDQQLTDSLQGERAEVLGRRAPIQVLERAQAVLELLQFQGRRAVGPTVVLLRERPVLRYQFVDTEILAKSRAGQPAAGRLPFGDYAGVLLPTRRRAVLAQQHVVAVAEAV